MASVLCVYSHWLQGKRRIILLQTILIKRQRRRERGYRGGERKRGSGEREKKGDSSRRRKRKIISLETMITKRQRRRE